MFSQNKSRNEISRSRATPASTPGRRTFTTTSRPSTRARWTWPRLAAAMGSVWNSSNSSSAGASSSSLITPRMPSTGSGGTWSWSLPISDRYGSGRISARALKSWASLMNVGPRAASLAVRRRARFP
jgi:hypothetical protein